MIEDVELRKILDSRGNATVEAEVYTDVAAGRFSCASGASTGEHEVVSFAGSVDKSIENFDEEKLIGLSVFDQKGFDARLHEMDGTDNFSFIGGNVATALSIACARCAANTLSVPLYLYLGGRFATSLPLPLGNVLGGGKHAVGGTDIQEYLVISTAPRFVDRAFGNAAVHKKVKELLQKRFPEEAIGKGDEGAWVAKLGNEEALQLVKEACDAVSDSMGFSVRAGLDIAASELFDGTHYRYKEKKRTKEEQISFVAELVDKYGLYYVEDPLEENDFDGFAQLTAQVGGKALVCGDDLFVTNRARVVKGIELKAANCVLIKPNQVGTLSDTADTVDLARKNGYYTVVSHRSGETEDSTIAHLAIAFSSAGIKCGAVGGERIAKLNELIRLEEEL
ncbi:MAG: phosphopyruvate hydratase [Candidatus Thermoplasmatota archaeon]|nr:phosphopyruvate hydratase [Candidatus Thermoplasmatota archaeon]